VFNLKKKRRREKSGAHYKPLTQNVKVLKASERLKGANHSKLSLEKEKNSVGSTNFRDSKIKVGFDVFPRTLENEERLLRKPYHHSGPREEGGR